MNGSDAVLQRSDATQSEQDETIPILQLDAQRRIRRLSLRKIQVQRSSRRPGLLHIAVYGEGAAVPHSAVRVEPTAVCLVEREWLSQCL